MDITKKSVIELKAMVYDLMGQKELAQQNINIINTELQKRATEAKLQAEKVAKETIKEVEVKKENGGTEGKTDTK